MDTLLLVNTIGAGLLVLQGIVLYIAIGHNGGHPRYQAFFVFWSLMILLASLFNYTLAQSSIKLPMRFDLMIDAIAIFALGLAAYCLLRGDAFEWKNSHFVTGFGIFLSYEILLFIFGIRIDSADIFWKVIYATPSAMAAAGAFVAIGVGVVRDPKVGPLRWPLLVLSIIYAILQPPYYYFDFIFPAGGEAQERSYSYLSVSER